MTATCTHGPSAVTRARCGATAVHTFFGSDGAQYFECATHTTADVVAGTGARVGDAVRVHRYGRTYAARVSRVGARGAVYATFAYGNGATRTVRVNEG